MNINRELSIPELRAEVLRGRFWRGLLLLGVELVDCARGIEVALCTIAGHKREED